MNAAEISKALCEQFLIEGNTEIASRIAEYSEIINVKDGQEIIQQGESGSDLYFILEGDFGVYFQGGLLSQRQAGMHVGEIGLVDPGNDRSATIAALEDSVVAKISNEDFTAIANVYPQLWRGIAVKLARRVRSLNNYFSGQFPEMEMALPEDSLVEV